MRRLVFRVEIRHALRCSMNQLISLAGSGHGSVCEMLSVRTDARTVGRLADRLCG